MKAREKDSAMGRLRNLKTWHPTESLTLRLVECSMFAAVTGLVYFLSNSLAIKNYFGCFFSLPIVISSMRWGVACGRKQLVATVMLLFVLFGPVKAIKLFGRKTCADFPFQAQKPGMLLSYFTHAYAWNNWFHNGCFMEVTGRFCPYICLLWLYILRLGSVLDTCMCMTRYAYFFEFSIILESHPSIHV